MTCRSTVAALNVPRAILLGVVIASSALVGIALYIEASPYVLAFCCFACGHSTGLWRAMRALEKSPHHKHYDVAFKVDRS